MNFKHLFLLACSAFVIYSCGGKIDRPAPVLTAEQVAQNQSRVEAPTIPSGGVVSGVKHYTCPNGHAGADAQGTCMSCGATLEHNQAFHDQPAAAGSDPAAATAEPPQNASGVWHYTCPNGHDGGSGSATACTVCGTTLEHNPVYHNTGATNTAMPDGGVTATPAAATPAAAAPEPAQNALGVWHYTCPNGHDGGDGSATACSECGTTLVHNTAYH